MTMIQDRLVVVRGAGDLATGVILRLVHSGFRVVALEVAAPSAIRRTVSLCEAVYDGTACVEGLEAFRCDGPPPPGTHRDPVPVVVDPEGRLLAHLRPAAVVDAILAKQNLGTRRDMAPVVVGLGPGFTAGADVHAVVETQRGHDLGRVILDGPAQPNSGVPGLIGGHGADRVLRAPAAGPVEAHAAIGDTLKAGDPVCSVRGQRVLAPFDGVLRGLIRPGFPAWEGLKVADVDPRGNPAHCFTVSDKARAIGGGVLEALLRLGSG